VDNAREQEGLVVQTSTLSHVVALGPPGERVVTEAGARSSLDKREGLPMIDSDFRALRTPKRKRPPPRYDRLRTKPARRKIRGLPLPVGERRWLRPRRSWHHRGVDDSEPDSASAEALIGCPIGPWELRRDGWYAEIQGIPAFQQTV